MKLTGGNTLMGIERGNFDAHAHVFTKDLPMNPGRRYTPQQDATFEAFCSLLVENGMDGALLVQPSFLGSDNTYLINALQQSMLGLQFRGVVMTTPDVSLHQLVEMKEAGVVGMRLNLLGQSGPEFNVSEWAPHLKRIAKLDWHLEVHIEGARLAHLLPQLLAYTDCLVVDHFGLPSRTEGHACSGLSALLTSPRERLVVKVSAPYRAFPNTNTPDLAKHAQAYLAPLLERLGPSRLAWGSDWPWTQHEEGRSYGETLEWAEAS